MPPEYLVPVDGDVIVRTMGPHTTAFVLYQTPSPAQIRCRTYATALAIATRWARLRHVDAWLLADNQTFAPLSRHRGGR